MNSGKRFAIVEDHNFWRQTIIDIVKNHIPDAEIVLEASNGRQFIQALLEMDIELAPTLVVLDLTMPIMDGFETARWLHENRPGTKVLTLSLIQNETSIIRLLGYGVLGFLHKNTEGEDLLDGIDSVFTGKIYISAFKNSRGERIDMDLGSLLKTKEVLDKWSALTDREQQFVKKCFSDVEYNEIAKAMKLQPSALESLKAKVFKTFGTINRISLFILLYRSKLL